MMSGLLVGMAIGLGIGGGVAGTAIKTAYTLYTGKFDRVENGRNVIDAGKGFLPGAFIGAAMGGLGAFVYEAVVPPKASTQEIIRACNDLSEQAFLLTLDQKHSLTFSHKSDGSLLCVVTPQPGL